MRRYQRGHCKTYGSAMQISTNEKDSSKECDGNEQGEQVQARRAGSKNERPSCSQRVEQKGVPTRK